MSHALLKTKKIKTTTATTIKDAKENNIDIIRKSCTFFAQMKTFERKNHSIAEHTEQPK